MTTTSQARFAGNLQTLSDRARVLMTRLNLYYAAVALLTVVNLYLLAQMALAWRAANSQNATALEQQTIAMKTAEIATKPLEGLDGKLSEATADSDQFYAKRLPIAYSDVVAELGELTKKQGVKLTRVQYADSPVLEGATGALTEVRMDASLSGDYRPLVLFINSLERDKMFFLIRGVTLTGQQSGTVGLRLSLTTYLRSTKGLIPATGSQNTSPSDAAGGGKAR
ncbi:hypothetical protein [Edaphobacter modestus]|uniref:Type IV pilus assembly protein PilO n=1 Tax=Edaphobacter modestus TaxID=388466 RepID=A0A4Q7YSA2_9BACT|nr:hypothetical protein [Edaphobacter modestus]RZU40597.1 hypothetical protein BDD14_2066 [Edaphobacter modestus]